jgi:hypothetical protein
MRVGEGAFVGFGLVCLEMLKLRGVYGLGEMVGMQRIDFDGYWSCRDREYVDFDLVGLR